MQCFTCTFTHSIGDISFKTYCFSELSCHLNHSKNFTMCIWLAVFAIIQYSQTRNCAVFLELSRLVTKVTKESRSLTKRPEIHMISYTHGNIGIGQYFKAGLITVRTWVRISVSKNSYCIYELLALIQVQSKSKPHHEVEHSY